MARPSQLRKSRKWLKRNPSEPIPVRLGKDVVLPEGQKLDIGDVFTVADSPTRYVIAAIS